MRAAILLAGGASHRFGHADKLLAKIDGRPLIAHALDRARQSDGVRTIVVLRRRDSRLIGAVRGAGVHVVIARRADRGLSETVRAGLAALRPIEREAWIFLADMPAAHAPSGMRLSGGVVAARPIVEGKPGHPMLVRVGPARAALPAGDRGLAGLRARRWRGTAGNRLDIDDRVALARLRRTRRRR